MQERSPVESSSAKGSRSTARGPVAIASPRDGALRKTLPRPPAGMPSVDLVVRKSLANPVCGTFYKTTDWHRPKAATEGGGGARETQAGDSACEAAAALGSGGPPCPGGQATGCRIHQPLRKNHFWNKKKLPTQMIPLSPISPAT